MGMGHMKLKEWKKKKKEISWFSCHKPSTHVEIVEKQKHGKVKFAKSSSCEETSDKLQEWS